MSKEDFSTKLMSILVVTISRVIAEANYSEIPDFVEVSFSFGTVEAKAKVDFNVKEEK